jgi:hypothetical protein
MTLSFWSPKRIASYSAMLLVHLLASLLNYNCAAQHSFIPEGDVSIVAALAPAAPQAPSQLMSYADSENGPSTVKPGSVHSSTKSAKICEFMALHFLKSTTCSKSSIAHLLILLELYLLLKMSFSDWLDKTLIVCTLK